MKRINSGSRRDLRRRLREAFKGRCGYCNRPVPLAEGTVDHKVAQVHGGGNEWHNLVWCCFECNQLKGALSLEEWEAHPDRVWLLEPPGPAESKLELLARTAWRNYRG